MFRYPWSAPRRYSWEGEGSSDGGGTGATGGSTAEAPSAAPAAAPAAPAPAAAGAPEATGDAAPAGAAGAEASSGPPATQDPATPIQGTWNGEEASVKQSTWFAALNPTQQAEVLAGLREKYQQWERGWRPRYEANATAEKQHREAMQQLEARRAAFERDQQVWAELLAVDDNGEAAALQQQNKQLTEELAQLRQERGAATPGSAAHEQLTQEIERTKQELQAQHEQATALLRQEYEAKLQEQTARVTEHEAKLQEYAAEKEAEILHRATEMYNWGVAHHPALMAEEAAFNWFTKMVGENCTKEEAADLTYAKFPQLKKASPDPVQPALAAMSRGTGAAGRMALNTEADYFALMQRRQMLENQ